MKKENPKKRYNFEHILPKMEKEFILKTVKYLKFL